MLIMPLFASATLFAAMMFFKQFEKTEEGYPADYFEIQKLQKRVFHLDIQLQWLNKNIQKLEDNVYFDEDEGVNKALKKYSKRSAFEETILDEITPGIDFFTETARSRNNPEQIISLVSQQQEFRKVFINPDIVRKEQERRDSERKAAALKDSYQKKQPSKEEHGYYSNSDSSSYYSSSATAGATAGAMASVCI